MKRIRTWYKNLMLHNKLLLSHVAVSLIPVIILGVFCYTQTQNLLIHRENEVLEETLGQNVVTLTGALSSYKTIMDNLTWNASLKQAITAKYETSYEMFLAYRDVIDPLIVTIKGLNPVVEGITIYSSNATLYPHGETFKHIDQMPISPETLQDSRIHWYIDDANRLEMYCKIYDRQKQDENVIYIQLNAMQTFAGLKGIFGEDYGVLVTDKNAHTVFSYQIQEDGAIPEQVSSVRAEQIEQSGEYVVKQSTIEPCDWNIMLYRPEAVISAAARSITFTVIVVALVCLGMVLLISLALSKSVVKPIDKLIQNMDQIENGRLLVKVQPDSSDEMGRLIQHFQKMVERLNYMVKEVYQSKILQQEYEMKALQAQINPHFLYNSLSLINWKAIMANQEEISEMAQLLSTFYRTTLNRGKNVTTVRGEWENTCSYTRIQSLMHTGKIEIDLEIEDAILDYEILNLLLQPLVENAIIHGLDHKESKEDKRLWVRGREDGEHLVFEVCDNGCGMPQDVLQTILTAQTKGYGVQNVHHRVQLYYGEQYGLTYESKLGEGTRVRLTIPRIEKQA